MIAEPTKVTVRALHQLSQGLSIVAGRPGASRFTLAAMLNRRTIQSVVDAVEAMTQNIPDFAQAYYREQQDVVLEIAQRDGEKNPIRGAGGGFVINNTPPNREKLAAIETKHAKAIAWINDHKKEMEKTLDTTLTVSLVTVPFGELPDGVSTLVMEQLAPMIDFGDFTVPTIDLPESLKISGSKKPE